MKALWLGLGLAFSVAAPVFAQNQPLTVERVFASPDLSGPKAVGVKLSPDGQWLTFLKPKAENAAVLDLWAVSTKGGEPFLLLDSNSLTQASKTLSEAEIARRERMRVSSRGVVEYYWAEDNVSLLVPLDGDIYRVTFATKAVERLTDTESDEVDAKLSPQNTYVSYVRDNRLFVKTLNGGQEMAISPEASDTISYGVAEFIAQEELDRYTGYWWSPNAQFIAYQVTDESGVETVQRVEVGGTGVKLVSQRYPFAGKANAKVGLIIHSMADAKDIAVDLGANPDFYLARVDWAKDGKSLFVQRLSRDQKTLDLLRVDPMTGAAKTVLSETSDSWVELHYDFKELTDGHFIWSSERDGNKQFYLYDPKGQLVRQITKGDMPVSSLADVDEKKGLLYFQAGLLTPLEMGLYVVSYKKPETPKMITPAGGWWATKVAGAKVFMGTYSDPTTPPNTALYDLKGQKIRDITPNRLDESHPYFAHKDRYSAPEFGILKAADGQDLHWLMLKPVGFDPAKKYPVIVSIYGGPARAMATRSWVSPANRLFQENGYIVFTLDNRGTPGRSVAFGRAIYKQFGGPDIDDQIAGANWLKTLPFVDGDHIGIMGWSQGGFVTLMAMTAKDTPFAAGAAGAPPTDWRLYDTAYTERYMSTPEDNPDGYRASDVLTRLSNLKPNSLLLMHGMADDNVQLSNTTRVMQALQERGIPFELMLYPGERHGVRGAEKNIQRYRLYLDFFDRKLKP